MFLFKGTSVGFRWSTQSCVNPFADYRLQKLIGALSELRRDAALILTGGVYRRTEFCRFYAQRGALTRECYLPDKQCLSGLLQVPDRPSWASIPAIDS